MKRQIILFLLALCSAAVSHAKPIFLSPETITYKVREDTFYSDGGFEEPYKPIKKDSVIVWTSERSVGPIYSVETHYYVKYAIDAFYNEKPMWMYTDALQVVDSELLTQENSLIRIIPEYYLEVLSKKNLAMIFEKQPLWLKTLEECKSGKYGPDSLEDFFHPEDYLLSNTIVSFSQHNFYMVKNIETIDDCKMLTLLRYRDSLDEAMNEDVYSDIYKKYQKDAYIKLFVQFDGDYVDLWINSKDNFMGRYIIAPDVLCEQIHEFMATKDIDLSKVTWPRYADGSCDYDDKIELPLIRFSENNKAGNATTSASENQGMEESKTASATELLEEEEKINLPDSDETKDEIKTDSAVKTDIKKEENDFAFPFIRVSLGIIIVIALLSIILAIAKKKKAGNE
ncbi:MAG: hypothetical protein K2N58_02380 [Treponemataceae bacterium]|nr:hypothetical protein [Treponemataceae bacterium]